MNSFASAIKKAFPVPRMLVLSDVAVKFFDGKLAFFEFSGSHGSSKPKAYGTMPFPQLRKDIKEDRAAFADACTALKAFASSKGYRLVRVIVYEGDVYTFKMRVPTLNQEELRPAIEAALEENVPIPPAEALFEYDVVFTDAVRSETSVAVTVISEKVIANYMALLDAAGLTAVSFETEARAIGRAFVPPGDAVTHAALVIEERHTVVFIVEKGVTTFSSSVDVGSVDLVRAVAKTFGVTEEIALSLMTGKATREGVSETAIFESMIPALSTLSDELSKVLLYFRGESQREEIGENPGLVSDILLSGPAARTPGFVAYIGATVRVPAKVGSVWTNVPYAQHSVPELDERSSLAYASLIGAHFS